MSDRDWQEGQPGDVSVDSDILSAVVGWLDSVRNSNVHSIVVARKGRLVFERYRKGPDERWREPLADMRQGPAVKHDLRSVTKCITGLLVGKALDSGAIPDLDVPVFDFFPEYADLRTIDKAQIRVRHLLEMSAGLDWDEDVPATDPANGEIRLWRADDHLRAALEPDVLFEPGAHWTYSGGCSELLGAIIQKATGTSLDRFAGETLFEPLGIRDIDWLPHRDGRPSASGGLRLCSPDLAKIGQLAACGGRWNGDAVIASSWIEDSFAPKIGAADRLFFYGYHWWLGRSLVSRREIRWAAGIGLGGQRLFVVPELELSVVVTAGHYNDAMQSWLPMVILNRFILPSVMDM